MILEQSDQPLHWPLVYRGTSSKVWGQAAWPISVKTFANSIITAFSNFATPTTKSNKALAATKLGVTST